MATGHSQVSSETIEKTKQQIRGLVGEIAQLSKSDLAPEEFYAAFLQRVVQALAAVGGAIWVLGEGNRPQLTYQMNLSPNLLDKESDDAAKHYRLLDYIVASKQGQLVPPLSGGADERMGANPTRQLLVVAPMGHDGSIDGLIEIFQRPDTQPATQRGYLRFLQQMCELAGEWFKNRKLRDFSDRHSLWAQADQFARTVHESLDVRETCYLIVNEGRRMLGCDRVTIAIKRGGKCIVEAVSGQDTLDNRSNVVTLLGQLATRVVATGEPMWYYGSTEDFPPQIEEAIEEYVDQSYTKSLAVLPLRKPKPATEAAPNATGEVEAPKGEIVGALIIEQIESEIPREVLDPRLDLVYEHSARALANAIDHNSLFLMPVWKTIGKASFIVQARTLPKTITIGSAILLTVLALFIIPWDFDMRAKGTLQPIDKKDVFVVEPGHITAVLVDNGNIVKEGDPLVRLRSDELPLKISQTQGELDARLEELSALRTRLTDTGRSYTDTERSRDQADYARAQVQVESLRKQLKLLEDRQENLVVRSPISGRVITWDAKRMLQNRPVETGQVLMSVAAEDTDYELELYMPERRVRHLVEYRQEIKERDPNADLQVDYILMTDPGKYHKGTVTEIHPAAEPHEEHGHMVRIKVSTDDEVELLRPGATVTADVHCGKAPLGWSLLHEAWEWLEANVFF
jgi:multidrug efflux pump subunit AcrA (membrane-fusion protein)